MVDDSKAFARFRATHDMSCQHGLHLDGVCKSCVYYYETESRIMACLKEDIRNWTLYQIDKRGETKNERN